MNEIYWVTRLDAFNTVFTVIIVISGIIFSISAIGYLANKCSEIEYDYKKEELKGYSNICKRFWKYSSMFLLFGILGSVFTPTTKQGLLIWGVGGSIDYLKSNPTAKQIPDKCIVALDKWVDSLSPDSTKKK